MSWLLLLLVTLLQSVFDWTAEHPVAADFAAVLFCAVIFTAVALVTAPRGYEDAHGFHRGEKPRDPGDYENHGHE